jgi:predicted ATPase
VQAATIRSARGLAGKPVGQHRRAAYGARASLRFAIRSQDNHLRELSLISSLAANNFTAVPYLETSSLMQTHQGGLVFSESKPNVLVGPNGAGKSALLTALALQTLTYFTGTSAFDDHYVNGSNAESFWSPSSGWSRNYEYLPGLVCESDIGPALYYRPGHIPGNDHSVVAAMMCGYFEQARAYGQMTKNRSSGQQCQALLSRLQAVLENWEPLTGYEFINWRYEEELRPSNELSSSFDHKAEALKKRYLGAVGKPVLLLDEPEQSLDTKAQLQLWKQIAQADMDRLQVIVATHSSYPLMHPERFNIIEAVPGYAAEVKSLL